MKEDLKNLLEKLDASNEKQSEYEISSQINTVAEDDESLEGKAERIAFSFCENYGINGVRLD